MQPVQDSKLLVLLASLNDQEFKELGLWVNSPIHNLSPRTIKLYDAIKVKTKKNKKIELHYLLKQTGIIKKEKQKKEISLKDVQQYRIAASKFTQQIQEFLIWKQDSQDSVRKSRVLMDQLIARKLYQLVPPILNKSKKQLEATQLRDIPYCINKYQLDEMQFYMHLKQKNRSSIESLKQVVESLQISCLSQLFRYYVAIVNTNNLISIDEDFALMHTLTQHMSNERDLKHFTAQIYFKLLVLIEKGSPDDYFQFKELLFNSIDSFNANELRQFFGFLTNFCSQMIAHGYTNFLQERLGIYKAGLKTNSWTAGIDFSNHQFVNIVNAGLKVNENEWVKEFIETYKNQLNSRVRQDTVHLCYALLEFENMDYSSAQDQLNQISKSEDFLHHSLLEVLLIKIYFLSEELTFENFSVHPIHSRLKAFQAYLKIASGKKLSPQMNSMYMNFILIFKQIILLKKKLLNSSKHDATAYKKLEISIKTLRSKCIKIKPLTERNWLLQEIGRLEG